MKYTNDHIVIEWLKTKLGLEFETHNIELDIPRYSALYFGKTITPGTAGRAFRKVRSTPDELSKYGIALVNTNELHPERSENTWKVVRSITNSQSVPFRTAV